MGEGEVQLFGVVDDFSLKIKCSLLNSHEKACIPIPNFNEFLGIISISTPITYIYK